MDSIHYIPNSYKYEETELTSHFRPKPDPSHEATNLFNVLLISANVSFLQLTSNSFSDRNTAVGFWSPNDIRD